MSITLPPARPSSSSNVDGQPGLEMDRLSRQPSTPGTPASPTSPTSPTLPAGGTPPRRLASELGLVARRDSDPGSSRPAELSLPPRQSLERLRPPPVRTSGESTAVPALPALPTLTPPSPSTTTSSRSSTSSTSSSGASTSSSGSAASAASVDVEAQRRPAPREAGAATFFLMQNVRHAGPVAAVRTVVQGVIAPEVARAVVSHPDAALAVQTALTAWSVGRRVASQVHSEQAGQVANRAFGGDASAAADSMSRRVWQGVQSAGILGGDALALGLTVAARGNPALAGVAQGAAVIQVVAHLQAQFREALRPAINTVHVGNGDPAVPQPPEGRNLRGSDITPAMRGTFGAAAAAIDMAAQLLSQRVLGGQPAWNASRGLAVGAGAIAGVANMLTSSVEDHLVDTASARRMQRTDASHVRHLHLDLRNPFTRNELGRQAERADTRVFNTMVPGLIALGVVQALQTALTQPGVGGTERGATQAGVHAAVAGLVGGALLALTVACYQLNDTVRGHNARQRAG